mmetsp:Transcript_114964/g.245489  ORF Transcript_114964/g.245489 Transcript_114964/m.245489 type:complete len:201 (+) Transcript_114964:526-1128(+)
MLMSGFLSMAALRDFTSEAKWSDKEASALPIKASWSVLSWLFIDAMSDDLAFSPRLSDRPPNCDLSCSEVRDTSAFSPRSCSSSAVMRASSSALSVVLATLAPMPCTLSPRLSKSSFATNCPCDWAKALSSCCKRCTSTVSAFFAKSARISGTWTLSSSSRCVSSSSLVPTWPRPLQISSMGLELLGEAMEAVRRRGPPA